MFFDYDNDYHFADNENDLKAFSLISFSLNSFSLIPYTSCTTFFR